MSAVPPPAVTESPRGITTSLEDAVGVGEVHGVGVGVGVGAGVGVGVGVGDGQVPPVDDVLPAAVFTPAAVGAGACGLGAPVLPVARYWATVVP